MLVLISLSLESGYADHGPVTLMLHETATVDSPRIRLGDIAHIEATDPDLRNTLALVEIGSAPRVGLSIPVTRLFVEQKIPAQWRARIVWEGRERVVVRADGVEFLWATYLDQARELLMARWSEAPHDFERIDIEPVSMPATLRFPRGTYTVELRLAGNPDLKKRMCVWLDVTIDGALYQSIPVWFTVKAYRPVWVARRPLAHQQRILKDDFERRSEDVAGISGAVAEFSEQVLESWLKRPLRRGEILTAANLETMPLVLRGKPVRVELVHGPVVIHTVGLAQRHGGLGDLIPVRNQDSNRIFAAHVTGAGSVSVRSEP